MSFEELTDDEWARIAALVADEPVHPHRRGRPRAETRVVTNAVLWILTTGERWSKLPARYPSGPTCRRRFDEWLADGTLMNLVRVLSETGRVFAYVPQPQPQTAAPAATKPVEDEPAESPRLRGVFWTNPESWQGSNACVSTHRAEAPVASSRQWSVPGSTLRGIGDRPRDQPAVVSKTVEKLSDEYCGYTIQVAAQVVGKDGSVSYRASAEIMKDGRRVERSGLIGPRFDDRASAECYAQAWARDWIGRHAAAAANANAPQPGAAAPSAANANVAQPPARTIDPSVINRPRDWLIPSHPDGLGDTKPPEMFYHA
jgi:transposase